MPTPPNPVHVADCGACGESFLMPEDATDPLSDGADIACPSCGARQGRGGVTTRTLGTASIAPPVEEPIEAPAPRVSEEPSTVESAVDKPVAAEATEATEATEALTAESTTVETPPTLADWLTRDQTGTPAETPALPTQAEAIPVEAVETVEPVAEAPAPTKQRLSETLGWSPTRFDATVDSPPPSATEPATKSALPESTTPTPTVERLNPAPSSRETETLPQRGEAVAEEAVATPSIESRLEDFRFDFGRTQLEEEPADEPEQVAAGESAGADTVDRLAGLSDGALTTEPRRRSWAGPLSALAGLMIVAGPAAYFGIDWRGVAESTAQADTSAMDRAERFDQVQNNAPVAADPPGDASPVPENDPYRDRSAVPASFEADAQPAANPAPAGDRYGSAVGSRYGSTQEKEPNPFATAEAMAADPLPAAEAPPTEPAATTPQPAAMPNPVPPEPTPFDHAPPVSHLGPSDPITPIDDAPPIESLPSDSTATAASFNGPIPSSQPEASLPPGAAPGPPLPAPTNGLIGAPSYPHDELWSALDAGVPSGKAFAAGTLANPDEVPAMGQHYARLCYLAQVLTLFDTESAHPDRLTTELEAADVFKRLFREAEPRLDSQQIAGPWIAWTGRPHGGVFFAGAPVDSELGGKVPKYFFELNGEPVTVVTDEPIDVKRYMNAGASEIGIIGVVVEQPSERIAGYVGDEQRVVWARKTLPLTKPQPRQ